MWRLVIFPTWNSDWCLLRNCQISKLGLEGIVLIKMLSIASPSFRTHKWTDFEIDDFKRMNQMKSKEHMSDNLICCLSIDGFDAPWLQVNCDAWETMTIHKKKSCFMWWFQQQQWVFASFLLNSAPIWCLFSLGPNDQVFLFMQMNKCDALLCPKKINMLSHWKHMVYKTVSTLTVCCWHHLCRSQPQDDVRVHLFSLNNFVLQPK